MFKKIIEKLELLGDEKVKAKYIKDGCDTDLFGVKVGDLKKIIKEYKINNDSILATELIESKNFDAMYLGFLIMNPSDIDKKLFIKWSSYSSYYRIRIHSLAYAMSEHEKYQYFIDYFKNESSDLSQSIYYAILAGRIIIDPNYNNQELVAIAHYIKDNINTESYQAMPLTKFEMHSLVGYIGMQVKAASHAMIEIANEYEPELEIDTNRRVSNNANFIKTAIDRNTVGKKRRSARC